MAKSIALLLRDIYMSVDRAVQDALTDAGFAEIQPGHAIVLRNLGEEGGRPSELAARSQVTRQAITKALDDLERLGLVTREADPSDGRGVIVRYTTRGLTGLHVARTRMRQVETEFAAAVGQERWNTVRAALEELAATSAAPAAPGPIRKHPMASRPSGHESETRRA